MSETTTKWIKIVVYKILREKNLLHLDIENLMGAGNLGYSQALQKFDPTRGVKLKTYAEHRIRGAVLDEVRKMIGDERAKTKRPTQVDYEFEHITDPNNSIDELESQIFIEQLVYNLNLSLREQAVLKMKYQGFTIAEIAQTLNISHSRASQLVAMVKRLIYNNYEGRLNFKFIDIRCPSCNGLHELSERVQAFECDYCDAQIAIINGRPSLMESD